MRSLFSGGSSLPLVSFSFMKNRRSLFSRLLCLSLLALAGMGAMASNAAIADDFQVLQTWQEIRLIDGKTVQLSGQKVHDGLLNRDFIVFLDPSGNLIPAESMAGGTLPADGDYVKVTGASSCEKSVGLVKPLILVTEWQKAN